MSLIRSFRFSFAFSLSLLLPSLLLSDDIPVDSRVRMWPRGWEGGDVVSPPHPTGNCVPSASLLNSEKCLQRIGLPSSSSPIDPNCIRSQSCEDLIAYKHFFHSHIDRTNAAGYYIEMGALDGLKFSNTYFFEVMFGWKGILIEADPFKFGSIKSNRPSAIVVGEIVCEGGEVTFIRGGATAGAVKYFAPAFYKRWYVTPNPDRKLTLQCQSLSSILETVHRRSGVNCYDFFSLDVEGAELSVVQTIDFTRFHFKVIVVEEDGSNVTREEALADILRSNGYVKYDMKEDSRNGWYVLRDDKTGCTLYGKK
jgi:hypothetical protein